MVQLEDGQETDLICAAPGSDRPKQVRGGATGLVCIIFLANRGSPVPRVCCNGVPDGVASRNWVHRATSSRGDATTIFSTSSALHSIPVRATLHPRVAFAKLGSRLVVFSTFALALDDLVHVGIRAPPCAAER